MLKSYLRGAFLATLLGVLACEAAPPPVALVAPMGLAAPAAQMGIATDPGPVPVTLADPSWGDANAPVTLVEFGDFQCPFCSKLKWTFDQLRQVYGPNRLRIVWKNNPLPFHGNARPAAEVAMALYAQGGASWFWQFHDAVFLEALGYKSGLPGLEAIAVAYRFTGLAPTQVNALVARGWAARKVDDDLALGKQIGVTGTPSAFINGVFLVGAQPIERYREIIDAQLRAAGALLAQGVPSNAIYARLAAENLARDPVPPPKPPEVEDLAIWRVPVGTSPVRGNPLAPVTMVVFADYHCPFSVGVAPTIATLQIEYGDQLRVVFKHNPMPFHARAEPAAELALEARAQKGDAGFWRVNDLLWAKAGKLEKQDFDEVAAAAGLDVAQTNQAIANHRYAATIAQDETLADDVLASGTPHFFINGLRLVGAAPIEKFRQKIGAQLALAQAEIGRGTSAAKLYETLIHDGNVAPPPEKKVVASSLRDSPSRGPANARVTVQIFGDFQCYFCKQAISTLSDLDAAYPGKLRFVWRNLPVPMHTRAPLAAEAAMEAFAQQGSAGFWKMHDLMFANLGEQPDALERPSLERYAASIGLDPAKLAAALDAHTHKAFVDADAAAASAAGIRGTPGFMINAYFVSGAQPLRKFAKVVDLALKEAR
jgi:protein-disulfide isomerase